MIPTRKREGPLVDSVPIQDHMEGLIIQMNSCVQDPFRKPQPSYKLWQPQPPCVELMASVGKNMRHFHPFLLNICVKATESVLIRSSESPVKQEMGCMISPSASLEHVIPYKGTLLLCMPQCQQCDCLIKSFHHFILACFSFAVPLQSLCCWYQPCRAFKIWWYQVIPSHLPFWQ